MAGRPGKTEVELPLVAAASVAQVEGAVPAALPRHRHRLSRETVRASQAMRIVTATAEIVAERGYAAASVGAIVERAGVSTRTFYELYADKEEAFIAAYAAIDAVIARVVKAAGTADAPREMLRAGVRAYLEALAEAPAFTRMFVIEAVAAGPRVLARRSESFGDFVRTFSVPLKLAAAAEPGLPEPDEVIVLAVLGGINELVLQHVVERGAETLPELAPIVDELIERVFFSAPRHGDTLPCR
jgi:AcrR family transcriptional regulator